MRIPKHLVEEVEQMVETGEYPNRSEAIRASVREILAEQDAGKERPSEKRTWAKVGSRSSSRDDIKTKSQDTEANQLMDANRENCFELFRQARFDGEIKCVHCESSTVVKRGKTAKGAQQYWCKDCETYFNDLTGTVFSQRRLEMEEMTYIMTNINDKLVAQIARDLDRDYDSVLDFVHKFKQEHM